MNLITNILITLISFFVILKFMDIFLTHNVIKKNISLYYYITLLLLSIITIFIPIYSITYIILYNIISFIFVLYYYNGSLKIKLIIFIIEPILLSLIVFSIFLIINLILGDSSFPMSSNDEVYDKFQDILMYTTLYILSYIIAIKIRYKKPKIKRTYDFELLSLITLCFISLILVITQLNIINFSIESFENLISFFFVLLIFIIIVTLNIYENSIKQKESAWEYQMKLELYEQKQAFDSKIDATVNELISLRHDLKNHFIAISSFLDSDNIQSAKEYLNKLTDYTKMASNIIITPSQTLSNILNAKLETCLNENICFNHVITISYLNISDTDIITIFSNILDNAIEASMKCPEDLRKIDLEMSQSNSNLLILCSNYYSENIEIRSNNILTSKINDKEHHGFGLKNVKAAIERNQGFYELSSNNNIFKIDISLYNPKP